MKFKYVGDMHAPEKIKFMGAVEFRLGEIVDVSDELIVNGRKVVDALKGIKGFKLIESDKHVLPVIDVEAEEVDEAVEEIEVVVEEVVVEEPIEMLESPKKGKKHK